MNREEILNKSRNENMIVDEREKDINYKSSAIAKAIGVALGFIIVFIERIFLETIPYASMAVFAVCFTMEAFESIYRFSFLKGKFNLIKSIVYSLLAISFIIALICLYCQG